MIPLPFEEEPDRLSSLERALSLPRAKRGNVSDFCNFYLQRWQVEDLTSRIALCRTKESIMDTGEVMLWLCDLDFLFRTNLCVVKFIWIDRIVRWLRCSWELMKVMSLKLYHYNLLARRSERIFRMRG